MASIEKRDIFNKVAAIIAEKIKIAPEKIQEESTLQSLGADSLDIFNIITIIEEKLGVKIDDQHVEKLHNVGDVVNYVHSLLNK